MSLEGSIKDFGLSDIFQLIHVQQKSGVMSIEHQTRRASVAFVKGMVVAAQLDGSEGLERIGDVLVRAKRITAKQLAAALKVQQERGGPLGEILVDEKMLSLEDLKRALRLQTLEAVYRLFRWREGRYAFDQEKAPYTGRYFEPISTEHILMEGVRRLDEWPYIEKRIPSLNLVFAQVPEKQGEIIQATSETIVGALTVSDDPLAGLDSEPDGRFLTDEITVYHAVNGAHPVSHIIELVQLGEFEVCKALANLMSAGLVVQVSVATGAQDSAVPSERRVSAAAVGRVLVWTGNAVLAGLLIGVPGWWWWQGYEGLVAHVKKDVEAFRILLLPHQVKGFQELVDVWKAEHPSPPTSLFEPMAAYGAAGWPLTDPWGRPWVYDAESGRIWVEPVDSKE